MVSGFDIAALEPLISRDVFDKVRVLEPCLLAPIAGYGILAVAFHPYIVLASDQLEPTPLAPVLSPGVAADPVKR